MTSKLQTPLCHLQSPSEEAICAIMSPSNFHVSCGCDILKQCLEHNVQIYSAAGRRLHHVWYHPHMEALQTARAKFFSAVCLATRKA